MRRSLRPRRAFLASVVALVTGAGVVGFGGPVPAAESATLAAQRGSTLAPPPGTARSGSDAGRAASNESTAQAQAARAALDQASSAAAAASATGPTIVPPVTVPSVEAVAPRRILDTRLPGGPTSGRPLAAGASLSVPVLGNGVPAAGVAAVLLNVTVVAGTAPGWVRVDDGTSTATSTVNVMAGQVVANQALVPVRDGMVRVTNGGGPSPAHVVLDIQGWVGAGAAVRAVTPVRVLDTRTASVRPTANSAATYSLPVPPGTTGVVANLLAVPRPGALSGYLTAYATGTPRPAVSHVNFVPGRPSSTLTVVPVDASGRVTIFNGYGPADVVIDVEGYVTSGVVSSRVYDSRRTSTGSQPMLQGVVRRIPVAGIGTVPLGTGAVLAHLTVTGSTTAGYLTGWAWGSAMPGTSSLNFPAGSTVTNTVLLPLGPDGALAVQSSAVGASVVVDIQSAVPVPDLTVTPPSAVPSYRPGGPADTAMARQSLLAADEYAMGPWWQNVAPGLLGTTADRYMATSGVSPNADAVRRLSMVALALSTSLATGSYDAATVGVSPYVAQQRLVTILRRVATTHVSTSPNGWGDSWQSTLWSGIAGRAAWLSWSSLPADVRTATARMVEHEARFAASQPVTYYRDSDGTLLSPGNTFAEELSWRMLPLQVALVMFPQHPDRAVWQNSEVRLALASWARPSDVGSTLPVAGATLGDWIDGSNVEQNGVVVNHGRIAPDYSTNLYQNVDGVLLDAVAGQPAPKALTMLLPPVYSMFSTQSFDPTTFLAPGGTVYTPTASIYYPQGNDWGTGQILPYALVDAEAGAFLGVDTTDALQRHLAGHLALVARFTDGHTYNPAEYNYVGREEHTAQLAAQLVLTQLVRDAGGVRTSDDPAWLG